jgi:DNA invertase Pin-like site-specific DNA recombinase
MLSSLLSDFFWPKHRTWSSDRQSAIGPGKPVSACLREQTGVLRVEDVTSGRTFARPGLQALLDYARAGDALCVVRLINPNHK